MCVCWARGKNETSLILQKRNKEEKKKERIRMIRVRFRVGGWSFVPLIPATFYRGLQNKPKPKARCLVRTLASSWTLFLDTFLLTLCLRTELGPQPNRRAKGRHPANLKKKKSSERNLLLSWLLNTCISAMTKVRKMRTVTNCYSVSHTRELKPSRHMGPNTSKKAWELAQMLILRFSFPLQSNFSPSHLDNRVCSLINI